MDLRDERVIRRLLSTGAIGLADGWIAGEFDSPDLASVIELGALHLERDHRPRIPIVLDRAGRRRLAMDRPGGRLARPSGPPWSTTTSATRSSASGWTGR